MGLFSKKIKNFSSYAVELSREEGRLKRKFKECFDEINNLGWLLLSDDDFKLRYDDLSKRVERLENEAEAAGDFSKALGTSSWRCVMKEISNIRWELKKAGWRPPEQTHDSVYKTALWEKDEGHY